MSALGRDGAVQLGGVKPQLPKIVIHVAASVEVREGCTDIGDATHYLRIELPFEAEEVRIPMNRRALTRLGRELNTAVGTEPTAHNE